MPKKTTRFSPQISSLVLNDNHSERCAARLESQAGGRLGRAACNFGLFSSSGRLSQQQQQPAAQRSKTQPPIENYNVHLSRARRDACRESPRKTPPASRQRLQGEESVVIGCAHAPEDTCVLRRRAVWPAAVCLRERRGKIEKASKRDAKAKGKEKTQQQRRRRRRKKKNRKKKKTRTGRTNKQKTRRAKNKTNQTSPTTPHPQHPNDNNNTTTTSQHGAPPISVLSTHAQASRRASQRTSPLGSCSGGADVV
ncbi:hypothetical protein BKA81DRAFT_376618 [Phyllosticta paracitricarpa]|uniref:Uncharacterized protein n=1 Tax=Phyllosticta citricarpa TaxID=55181 RepID=A0ABR1MHP7_9PEZI